jgi:hypothetical protein
MSWKDRKHTSYMGHSIKHGDILFRSKMWQRSKWSIYVWKHVTCTALLNVTTRCGMCYWGGLCILFSKIIVLATSFENGILWSETARIYKNSRSRSAMHSHIKQHAIEPYHINQGYRTMSTVNMHHTGHSTFADSDMSVHQLTQFSVKRRVT